MERERLRLAPFYLTTYARTHDPLQLQFSNYAAATENTCTQPSSILPKRYGLVPSDGVTEWHSIRLTLTKAETPMLAII
jgi:hypothetical protein